MVDTSATCMPISRQPNETKRLAPEDIEYLVFEGGGGKGFAYLGALQVLEELNVLSHVKGFAGASAGAITALLLSIGYTSESLGEYLNNTDFTRFFDSPSRRSRPIVGNCRLVDDTEEDKKLFNALDCLPDTSLETLLSLIVSLLGKEIEKQLDERKNKPPVNLILKHWKKYFTYMRRDMGLFDGCEARREFDRILSERFPSYNYREPRYRSITFKEHYQFFKKELLITGSNLSTGKTQLFSHTETPEFPVADAVRISMSLPFIYKPYIISETKKGWPPCGTYVDGGLWNNLPYREFEGMDSNLKTSNESASLASTASFTKSKKPKTLGLRLEFTPFTKIETFGEFLTRVATFGIFGTGETQVLSKHTEQMILLDTRGLDLVDFKPEKKKRDQAIKRARRATWRYFNMPIPEKDVDDEDDQKTEYLRRETIPCGTLVCD